MKYLYACLLWMGLCISPALSADEAPQNLDELKQQIEKIRQETGLPGLGIALVDEHGPLWVTGLGEADVSAHKAATENTLFRIGSTSKMFVALSILQLVEQGKLDLQAKVHDLVPDIYFDNPWESSHPIRVVHLLEHTTGWDDISYGVYAHQDEHISLKDALAYHSGYRHSRWVPGTRYAYNNAGPAVAAYIIERITGQTYEDYVQTHIFQPLGMDASTFYFSNRYQQQGATLYSMGGSPLSYWHILVRPAGAINSSPVDMAKFLQFLIQRGQQQPVIISENSFNRMETPTTTLGARAGTGSGYGLNNYATGFEEKQIAFRGHDGDVLGGHCRLSYIPELKTGYVLLFNQDNPRALEKIPELLRVYLTRNVHKPTPKTMTLTEQQKALAGYYLPINWRLENIRGIGDVFGIMQFRVSDNQLHRMPLLGGWKTPSTDVPTTAGVFVNLWTGLPNIAQVKDPLAGDVVEVSDDIAMGGTLKKISAFRAWAPIVWFGLWGLLNLSSFIQLLVGGIYKLSKSTKAPHLVRISGWPFLLGISLFTFIVLHHVIHPLMMGEQVFFVISLVKWAISIGYPLATAYLLIRYCRQYRLYREHWYYWHALAFLVLHAGVAGWMLGKGVVGTPYWL